MAADRSGKRRRLKPYTTVYISHSTILCCVDANAYKWNAYNEYTVAKNIIEYAWTMRGNGNNAPILGISSKKKKTRKITTPRYLQWKRVPIEQITITTKTPKSGSIALGDYQTIHENVWSLFISILCAFSHSCDYQFSNCYMRLNTLALVLLVHFGCESIFFCSSLCCSTKTIHISFFGIIPKKLRLSQSFSTCLFLLSCIFRISHIPRMQLVLLFANSKAQQTIYIDNTSEIGKLHIDRNWIGLRCVKCFVHTMQLDAFHCVSATTATAVDVLICRCKPLCRYLKNVRDSFLQSELRLQSHSKDDN